MRRPQQIDPKTLRKHSRIMEKLQAPPMVVGPREQTDYGYFVEGSKTKSFETKFLTVMPQCMTPTWKHEKKTRVYRVVSGVGIYQTFDKPEEGQTVVGKMNERHLTHGDEVVVSSDTTHRITAGPGKLELYVTQDSKYESSLQEVMPAEVVAQVSAAELTPLTEADKQNKVTFGVDRSMRRNRVAQQIAEERASRPAAPTVPRSQRGQSSHEFFRTDAGGAGINVKPVMNFDAEGAG